MVSSICCGDPNKNETAPALRDKISSFQQKIQLSFNNSTFHSNSTPIKSNLLHTVTSTASGTIAIAGKDFGCFGTSGIVKVLESACEGSNWMSDTSLRCKASVGNRILLTAVVSVSTSTDGSQYQYAKSLSQKNVDTHLEICPQLHGQKLLNCKGPSNSGSSLIIILGRLYASVAGTITSQFGSTCTQKTNWISESSIMAKGHLAMKNISLIVSANQVTNQIEVEIFNRSTSLIEIFGQNINSISWKNIT